MNKPFTKDATWAINYSAIKKLHHKQIILIACDAARLVLPIWEQQFPKDNRPRTAIETAELFVYGQITNKQLEKIRSAAVYIARYAAANAVSDNVNAAANAVRDAVNTASYAANAADAAVAAFDAVYAVYNATRANPQILPIIHSIFHQTKQITIPTTPILKAIAHNIIQTRNFQEYNILLDNLEEVHNIQLERTMPLGLSHYVLYHLTNTH